MSYFPIVASGVHYNLIMQDDSTFTVRNQPGTLFPEFTRWTAGPTLAVLGDGVHIEGPTYTAVEIFCSQEANAPYVLLGGPGDGDFYSYNTFAKTTAGSHEIEAWYYMGFSEHTGGLTADIGNVSNFQSAGIEPNFAIRTRGPNSSFDDSAYQMASGNVTTSNATPANVYSLGLVDNSVYSIEATIIGRKSDGTDRAMYKKQALVYRQGGGATLQGSVADLITPIETNASWDATIGVGSNSVNVTVTGVAATTIYWAAMIRFQRVTTS